MSDSAANLYVRLRKLEADRDKTSDRVTRMERQLAQLLPPPEYDGHMPDPGPIWPVPVKEPN